MICLKKIIIRLGFRSIALPRLISYFSNYILGSFRNSSVKDYLIKNNISFQIEDPNTNREIYIPRIVNGNSSLEGKVLSVKTPIIFSSVLNDVYVFSCCDTMLIDKKAINEKFSYSFSRYYYHCSPGGNYKYNTNKKSAFFFRKPTNIIDEGINLFGEASSIGQTHQNNY